MRCTPTASWLGHLPGVALPHEFMPQPGDLFWTPADWAWAGGLLNVLLPGLHFGVPVVAHRFTKFDPDAAFRLMADHGIRNAFVAHPRPCACCAASPTRAHDTIWRCARSASGGEALGAETLAWGREALGLSINEFYGQTECNLVLASCAAIGVTKPGAIGKPVPGHRVASDAAPTARCCPPGETGQNRRCAAGSGDVSPPTGTGPKRRRPKIRRRPG